MAGFRGRLTALKATLRALRASGALEQRQEEELVKALEYLCRAASTGRRREVARSVDKLSRIFIRIAGGTENRGN